MISKNEYLARVEQLKTHLNPLEFSRLRDNYSFDFCIKLLQLEQKYKASEVVLPTSPPAPEAKKADYIHDYPSELSGVYRQRLDCHLKICALKKQLNDCSPHAHATALKIQRQMWTLLAQRQGCWDALNYYKQTGRILQEPSQNLENKSLTELYKEKALLESTISKRQKTLFKMQQEGASRDKILRKFEQLNSKINQLKTLKKLIGYE